MFVAFLLTHESSENGCGFMEIGETEAEATAKLKAAFIAAETELWEDAPDEEKQDPEASWEAIDTSESDYHFHINEVK